MHRNSRQCSTAGLAGFRSSVKPVHPTARQIPVHLQIRENKSLRILAAHKIKAEGGADLAVSAVATYQPAAIDRLRFAVWSLDLGAGAIGLRLEAGERAAIEHPSAATVQTSFQKPFGVELRQRQTAKWKVGRDVHRRPGYAVVERRNAM